MEQTHLVTAPKGTMVQVLRALRQKGYRCVDATEHVKEQIVLDIVGTEYANRIKRG